MKSQILSSLLSLHQITTARPVMVILDQTGPKLEKLMMILVVELYFVRIIIITNTYNNER